jgi:Ca2+-binding EF-hand superfamily protein
MKPQKLLPSVVLTLVVAGWFPVVAAQPDASSQISSRRAAALKKHDKDGDGKLSDAERETMRKAVAAQRLRASRSGFGAFMLPPEVTKKYDKDGDGVLDEEESQAAREGMRKQFEEVRKKYDKNGDGNLDAAESEAMRKDAEAGKIEGVPRFFGGPRPPGFGRPQGPSREMIMQQADKNRDGRLSAEELQTARAELAKQRPGQAIQPSADNPQPK